MPVEGALLQLLDVGILALHVGEAVLGIAPRRLPLDRLVAPRLAGVGAEEVADGEVAELFVAAGRADVEVMGARSLWRLPKKWYSGESGKGTKR
jgi:hypothetical protein